MSQIIAVTAGIGRSGEDGTVIRMDLFLRTGRKYRKLLLQLRKEETGGERILDLQLRTGEYRQFLFQLRKETPGCRLDLLLRTGK